MGGVAFGSFLWGSFLWGGLSCGVGLFYGGLSGWPFYRGHGGTGGMRETGEMVANGGTGGARETGEMRETAEMERWGQEVKRLLCSLACLRFTRRSEGF